MGNKVSRRTVLGGVGATLALPWLESVAWAKGDEPDLRPPLRLGTLIFANGVKAFRETFPATIDKSSMSSPRAFENWSNGSRGHLPTVAWKGGNRPCNIPTCNGRRNRFRKTFVII